MSHILTTSGPSTINCSAAFVGHLYYQPETEAARYMRLSNRAADAAAEWALTEGDMDSEAAQSIMETADALALLSRIARQLDYNYEPPSVASTSGETEMPYVNRNWVNYDGALGSAGSNGL